MRADTLSPPTDRSWYLADPFHSQKLDRELSVNSSVLTSAGGK
jgi:hypothetical protein